jgi:HK97 family phage portal protein
MVGLLERIDKLLAVRRAAEPRDPDASRVGWQGKTLAGVYVTPDNAVQIAAVWACLRYLSQTVAMLPWNVLASDGAGAEVQAKHPVQWLIHTRPNPEWSSFQFRETLTHWALRWGNGYAEIEPDMAGRPYALWPIHPERVDPKRDADGRLYFAVNNGSGQTVDIPPERMFHIRGFGEGPVGVNVIEYAAQSLGWAKAMQVFGATFFGNGANLSGVVQSKGKFEPGPLARLKTEFNKLFRGPRNSNSTGFLDNGMEWKPVGVKPLDAQMIDANNFLISEICRWFGIPPHKVALLDRATFSNIEHQAIEVVQDSILPWVRRFEDEADYKLFGQNRQGFYTKLELRGLLRGDFDSQVSGLKTLRDIGAVNANEVREYLDMPPQPAGSGGDKYTMQGQYTTLDKVGEEPPAPPAAPATTNEDPSADPAEETAQEQLATMAERAHVAAEA